METSGLVKLALLPIELVQLIALFVGFDAFKWNNKAVIQGLVQSYEFRGYYDPYVLALSTENLCVIKYVSEITSCVPSPIAINNAATFGDYDLLCLIIKISVSGMADEKASFLLELESHLPLLAYHGHLETLKKCYQLIPAISEETCKDINQEAALGGQIEILDWLVENNLLVMTDVYCGIAGCDNANEAKVSGWVNNLGLKYQKNDVDYKSIIISAINYDNQECLKTFIGGLSQFDDLNHLYDYIMIATYHQSCFEYLVTLLQNPADQWIISIAMEKGYLSTLDFIWEKESNHELSDIFTEFDIMCKSRIHSTPVKTLRWLKEHGYEFDIRSVKWSIKGGYQNIKVVKFLVEESDFEVDIGGACRNAVICGNLDILSYLFEKGYHLDREKCLQIAVEKVEASPSDEDAKKMLTWLQSN